MGQCAKGQVMKKNELYEIEITDINNLGNGVGKIDGMTVFVPGAVDSDRLLVKIIKVASDYAVARIEKIITPSKHRIKSDCELSNRCGGCVYRNISYEHERQLKRSYVENAFKKAGLSPKVCEVEYGRQSGYRNKVQYPIGQGLKYGFYANHTHEVISGCECALEDKAFAPIMAFACETLRNMGVEAYDEQTGLGILRHIYLRRGTESSHVMVCLVINKKRLKCADEFAKVLVEHFPSVKTVVLNINQKSTNVILGKEFAVVYGKGYIEDSLCGVKFRISAPSFWQINHEMAERLYKKAAELASLKEGEILCDLFCGIGSIGLTMIKDKPQASLLGVEIVPEAVENARENAEINGIQNARFVCADASSAELQKSDVIVLDPPRKGCTPELVRTVAEISPRAVVYVSCNPDTLARDCAQFKRLGYVTDTVYPFDLFPRTGHIENLCLLTKKQGEFA